MKRRVREGGLVAIERKKWIADGATKNNQEGKFTSFDRIRSYEARKDGFNVIAKSALIAGFNDGSWFCVRLWR
jgi:hypothetical protein